METQNKPKAVSLMQPCYFPWLGHFHLWLNADEIVWLDTFQYSRSSFHSRNRIAANNEQGWQWLTVPVTNHLGDSLREATFSATSNWRRKHVQTITMQYARAPFHAELGPLLNFIAEGTFTNLAELNVGLLERLGQLLGITVPTRRASSLELKAQDRSERVKELLRVTGATTYLVARGSVDYMQSDGGWDAVPFNLKVQNFTGLPYPQVGKKKPFVSHLSILDAVANLGAVGVSQLLHDRSSDWQTFAEATSVKKP